MAARDLKRRMLTQFVSENQIGPTEVGFAWEKYTHQPPERIEGGVIDPKKVTRSGLMNACSIAGMVLTTQAVITEIPEEPMPIGAGPAAPDPNMPGNFSL